MSNRDITKSDTEDERKRGRPGFIAERTLARFPSGTLARITAALEPNEKQSDFIRQAVDRELKRRERAKP